MSSLANKLLQHSDDNRKEILAIFGKNEVSVTQDLEAIKKWILKIEYLPSNISTKKIEIFLILNKFKIEKTKEKLQLYYKSKNSNSDLIRRTYATDTRMQECIDKVIHVPLPKLVDNKRVIFVDFKPDSAEFFDQVALGAYLLRMLDVLFEEDYALGSIIVWNIKNFNVKHLCKVDVSVLKSMQNVVEKVCSGRIFAVHVVHPPAVFGKIYNIFKTLLKSKYIQRIHVHNDVESLMKYIPRDVLPKDLGGEEMWLNELVDLWRELLLEKEEYFQELNNIQNVMLPDKDIFNDELFGADGNFRQLEID